MERITFENRSTGVTSLHGTGCHLARRQPVPLTVPLELEDRSQEYAVVIAAVDEFLFMARTMVW